MWAYGPRGFQSTVVEMQDEVSVLQGGGLLYHRSLESRETRI